MLVVLLLLPISLAVDNGEFDHHGGSGGGGSPAAVAVAAGGWRWTTIGGKSSWQQER
jgi:hypothetical protein